MNRSKEISPRRILASMAMLLGAMVTTMLLPAYGQQEVDPTWYDPYAVNTPAPAAIHTVAAQPAAALHRHQTDLAPVLSARNTGKAQAKRTSATSKISAVSVLRDPNQEAKVQQIASRRDESN